MHDPLLEGRFDPSVFPPALRVTSLVLSTLVIGLILFEVFAQATRIVA